MAKGFKTGGREQGTPNKVTKDVRELINTFIGNNIGNIQEIFDELQPKEKMYFVVKMLDYVIPKLKSIEVENKNEKTINWIETKTTSIEDMSKEQLLERVKELERIENMNPFQKIRYNCNL